MLSKIYTHSVLLLGASSVLASPLTTPNTDYLKNTDLAVEVGAGVYVLTGQPEILGLSSPRSVDTANDANSLDERGLILGQLTPDQTEAKRLHNVERAGKKVPDLAWDANLAQQALTYAQYLATNGLFQHSANADRPNQGENLAYSWTSDYVKNPIKNPITLGTNGWLAERQYYTGQVIPQGNFELYGHYTQAMWNTSTKVGIATATDGKGAWYTVARYSPPGNYYGLKPF